MGDWGNRFDGKCVTYQSTHNQHGSLLLDVFSACDYVPFLAVSTITGSDLNGSKVGAEVA